MRYRFDDYTLNPAVLQLTKSGEPVDVPKRVFGCISYLIEHRQRAIGRDELIRKLWGRDNVSDNQLAHVVHAARNVLNDDGAAQRLIRTVPGLGYHWVGEVTETADPIATSIAPPQERVIEPTFKTSSLAPMNEAAPAPETETETPPQAHAVAEASEPHAATIAWYHSGKLRAVAALALTLVLVGVTAVSWQLRKVEPAAATAQLATATAEDPFARLEDAFWQGKYEDVREGLAKLPAYLADSPDARLLDIRLDIERGRFDRAAEKLLLQQAKAKAADDPIWQAKLFVTQSFLNGSAGRPGLDVLTPAQLAVNLVESAGHAASPQAMGEALSARGYGLMKTDQLEPAVRDLIRARALLLKAGGTHDAADTADTLARVQMRMGRLMDALALMTEIADSSRQAKNPVQEIYARNAITKIQIELLRWGDALASIDRSTHLLQTVPHSERRTRVLQLRALVLTGMGRLREATSLIEEGEAMNDERYSSIIPATYHLASGHTEQALADARQADAFFRDNTDDGLNLESKEGALLLWIIAAQDLSTNGKAMPMPSPAQLEALQRPTSDIGRIASGRWLWSQGKSQDAEAQLRLALAKTRQMGHLSRMLLASEPLIELLLQRGDATAAEQVLAELQGYDPQRMDQDYRANLLGLRVALALGSRPDIASAYQRTAALAGERTLPAQVLFAYEAKMRSPNDRRTVKNTASRF